MGEARNLEAVVGEDGQELGDGDVVRAEEGGEIGALHGLYVDADRVGRGGGGGR